MDEWLDRLCNRLDLPNKNIFLRELSFIVDDMSSDLHGFLWEWGRIADICEAKEWLKTEITKDKISVEKRFN